MPHAVIIGEPRLFCIIQRTLANHAEIFIYDTAFFHIHDIMETSSFMHPQRQRPILVFIPKGKLHLIAVCILCRAFFNAIPDIISVYSMIHHFFYLLFL